MRLGKYNAKPGTITRMITNIKSQNKNGIAAAATSKSVVPLTIPSIMNNSKPKGGVVALISRASNTIKENHIRSYPSAAARG